MALAVAALVMIVLSGAVHSVADADAPAASQVTASATTVAAAADLVKGSTHGKAAGHACAGHCATHGVAMAPVLAIDVTAPTAVEAWRPTPPTSRPGATVQGPRRPPRA